MLEAIQIPKVPLPQTAVVADPTIGASEGAIFYKMVSSSLQAFIRLGAATVQLTDLGGLFGVGEVNTAANEGTGEGEIFKDKVGPVLNFRKLKAGAHVSITTDVDGNILISTTDYGEVNYGLTIGTLGVPVYKSKSGEALQFRRIKAGANVTVTQTLNDEIEIASTGGGGGGSGEANTASNTGTGAGLVFKGKVGVDLVFNKIKAGANTTVTMVGDDIVIASTGGGGSGEANTASNASAGTGAGNIFKVKSGVDLVFKKIKAGANVTVTDGTDDITIAASGGGGGGTTLSKYSVGSSNEETYVWATGAGISLARVGTTLTFTIPSGVRLLSARLRLPMATIGGTSVTVVYGDNGGNDGGASAANSFQPMVQAWREDSGAQVAISSSILAGWDRMQVNGLALNQSNLLRMSW